MEKNRRKIVLDKKFWVGVNDTLINALRDILGGTKRRNKMISCNFQKHFCKIPLFPVDIPRLLGWFFGRMYHELNDV